MPSTAEALERLPLAITARKYWSWRNSRPRSCAGSLRRSAATDFLEGRIRDDYPPNAWIITLIPHVLAADWTRAPFVEESHWPCSLRVAGLQPGDVEAAAFDECANRAIEVAATAYFLPQRGQSVLPLPHFLVCCET